jgi:hypothetical protein
VENSALLLYMLILEACTLLGPICYRECAVVAEGAQLCHRASAGWRGPRNFFSPLFHSKTQKVFKGLSKTQLCLCVRCGWQATEFGGRLARRLCQEEEMVLELPHVFLSHLPRRRRVGRSKRRVRVHIAAASLMIT